MVACALLHKRELKVKGRTTTPIPFLKKIVLQLLFQGLLQGGNTHQFLNIITLFGYTQNIINNDIFFNHLKSPDFI